MDWPTLRGFGFANPRTTGTQLGKKYCTMFQVHDIKGGLIGAAVFTLLGMAAIVFRHVYRTYTLRKDPTVDFYEPYRSSSKLAGVAVAPDPAPAVGASDIAHETSPIDPSEDHPCLTLLASEAVLRDSDSPEENEAWAHL